MNSNKYIRTVAIVMLFAMFHYIAGYRLLYSLGVIYTKEEAKECMIKKSGNTQKLILTATEYTLLHWTEKNKEFSLHKQMYDVESIQRSGDNYILSVYADNPETKLVKNFHSYEKELFHPAQSNKGAKSAEDIMSSFQKAGTPVYEYMLPIFDEGSIKPAIIEEQHYSVSYYATIWHPPIVC